MTDGVVDWSMLIDFLSVGQNEAWYQLIYKIATTCEAALSSNFHPKAIMVSFDCLMIQMRIFPNSHPERVLATENQQ